jgi:hypothetical protein
MPVCSAGRLVRVRGRRPPRVSCPQIEARGRLSNAHARGGAIHSDDFESTQLLEEEDLAVV